MGKINIQAKLRSNYENLSISTTAIKTKNKIVYKENNILVTILIFSNKIHMKRSCAAYEIDLKFELKKNTISKYKLFGGSKVFNLETYTKKLLIKGDIIKINYILEENEFNYVLNIGGVYA